MLIYSNVSSLSCQQGNVAMAKAEHNPPRWQSEVRNGHIVFATSHFVHLNITPEHIQIELHTHRTCRCEWHSRSSYDKVVSGMANGEKAASTVE